MAKTKAICIINRSTKLTNLVTNMKENMARVVKIVPLILMTGLIFNMKQINYLLMTDSMNVSITKMMMICVLKYPYT